MNFLQIYGFNQYTVKCKYHIPTSTSILCVPTHPMYKAKAIYSSKAKYLHVYNPMTANVIHCQCTITMV